MATEQVFFAVEIETSKALPSLGKIRGEMQKLKNKNAELNKEFKEGTRSQESFGKAVAKNDVKLKNLSAQYREATNAASGLTKANLRFRDKMALANVEMRKSAGLASTMKEAFGGISIAMAGAFASQLFFKSVKHAVEVIKEFDESVADLMKTTGLAKEDAKSLAAQLIKIDTRTSVKNILALASAAGRLGLEGQELIDFTKQADMVFVALGDTLEGSAEDIALTMGKLASSFGIEEEFGIGESINKIGSVINELGATTKATEGPIIDFTKRLAGVASQAGITLPEIAALGALFDANGQSMEVAATTFQKLLPAMGKDVEAFSKVAGVSIDEFSELLRDKPFEALKLVAEGAKSTDKGLLGLTDTLAKYGIKSARAASIVALLSSKTKDLNKFQAIANAQMENATSISAEFAIKNNTLNASTEKLSKSWDVMILAFEDGDGVFAKLAMGGLDLVRIQLDNVTNILDVFSKGEFLNNAGATIDAKMNAISVSINGVSGSTDQAIKDFVLFGDSMLLSMENGTNLNELLKPFANKTLKELTVNLSETTSEFVASGVASGELATDSERLFKAYISLRQESENVKGSMKGLARESAKLKEEEIEAIKVTEKVIISIVSLQKELALVTKSRNELSETDKAGIKVSNKEIETLKERIKILKELRDKNDTFSFSKLKHIENIAIALDDEDEESEIRFNEEDQRRVDDLARKDFFRAEGAAILVDGLQATQDLTNVFTQNKLNALKRESRAELAIIDDRERRGTLTRDQAEQARRLLTEETDKKTEALEKKAFKRNKAFNIASAIINTAAAVALALASSPPPVSFITAGVTGVLGGLEIATIAAQKFGKGGKLAKGGIISGPSHSDGGVSIMGGRAEVEGDEIILNRGVTHNPTLAAMANQINVMGGGDSFMKSSGNNFEHGGVLSSILPTFELPQTDNLSGLLDAIRDIQINSTVSVSEINSKQANVRVSEGLATIG